MMPAEEAIVYSDIELRQGVDWETALGLYVIVARRKKKKKKKAESCG